MLVLRFSGCFIAIVPPEGLLLSAPDHTRRDCRLSLLPLSEQQRRQSLAVILPSSATRALVLGEEEANARSPRSRQESPGALLADWDRVRKVPTNSDRRNRANSREETSRLSRRRSQRGPWFHMSRVIDLIAARGPCRASGGLEPSQEGIDEMEE